jgi:hypothetical protein
MDAPDDSVMTQIMQYVYEWYCIGYFIIVLVIPRNNTAVIETVIELISGMNQRIRIRVYYVVILQPMLFLGGFVAEKPTFYNNFSSMAKPGPNQI